MTTSLGCEAFVAPGVGVNVFLFLILPFSTKGQIYLENNDFHEAIMSLEAIARDRALEYISYFLLDNLFSLSARL